MDEIRKTWLTMEADLGAHLRAEEELILPAFERSFPHEAARIRREHGEIRQSLEQLGLELDLHTLRAERADAFIEALRAHAEHEELVFYDWAQQHLPSADKDSVLGRLRARLHSRSSESHTVPTHRPQ